MYRNVQFNKTFSRNPASIPDSFLPFVHASIQRRVGLADVGSHAAASTGQGRSSSVLCGERVFFIFIHLPIRRQLWDGAAKWASHTWRGGETKSVLDLFDFFFLWLHAPWNRFESDFEIHCQRVRPALLWSNSSMYNCRWELPTCAGIFLRSFHYLKSVHSLSMIVTHTRIQTVLVMNPEKYVCAYNSASQWKLDNLLWSNLDNETNESKNFGFT